MTRLHKLLLAVCAVGAFAFPAVASAAIAFDNSTSATGGAVSSLTFNLTVNTLSNTTIFISMTDVDGNHRTVSVTNNGSAVTDAVNRVNDTTCLGNRAIYLGTFNATSTGNQKIVITFSGAISSDVSATAASYTGVHQTTPTDSSTQNIDTQCLAAAITSLALTTTTTVDNDWLIGTYLEYGNSTVTAGSNTTIRQQATGAGNDRNILADSNSAQTPAGSKTLNLNLSPADNIGGYVFGIRPAAVTAAAALFGLVQSFLWGDW